MVLFFFSDDIGKKVKAGKLLTLTTIFYNPDEDQIEYCFPDSRSIEESIAMLRKFGAFRTDQDGKTDSNET